jgi:outer membrane immunogenic protein
MKSLLLGGSIAITLSVVSPASAGDLASPAVPLPPGPPPPVVGPWTGIYVGANIGGAWANGTVTDSLFGQTWSTDQSGFLGGGQVGFNYQISNVVFGAEWDFDWTSLSATGSGVSVPGVGVLQASANTDWVTTVAAKFGLAFDRMLFYGKAGGGWVGNNASINNLATGASITASTTNGGWLVGAGVEYALAPNWTTKVEYDYLGLRNWSWNTPGILLPADTFTVDRNIQMLKVGVNYKFNLGAPIAARY